jgi:hypothetical protein
MDDLKKDSPSRTRASGFCSPHSPIERPPTDKGAAVTKPREIVNVHHMVNDVDEAIALDRRKFIKGVGFAVSTVQCLPLIAHSSGNSPSDGNEAADNLIIHSSSGFLPHVHDLLIPYAF